MNDEDLAIWWQAYERVIGSLYSDHENHVMARDFGREKGMTIIQFMSEVASNAADAALAAYQAKKDQ